jgi:hypothetical protein
MELIAFRTKSNNCLPTVYKSSVFFANFLIFLISLKIETEKGRKYLEKRLGRTYFDWNIILVLLITGKYEFFDLF